MTYESVDANLVLPIAWDQLREAFTIDGSWRDIYVLETDLAAWERVLAWLHRLDTDGVARVVSLSGPFPRPIAEMLAERAYSGTYPLHIHIGDVQINTHFFTEEEIEFDIDPSEIKGPEQAVTVIGFMRGLAEATNSPVHMTEENRSNQRWLTFDPRTGEWEFLPTGGN